jgi:DNA-binding LacI/PurR family transcriptional regulator
MSYPSVSEILNGGKQHRYAKATVARVQRAAKKLGYEVHPFAKSLKTGKTNIIGVTTLGDDVLGDFNIPYAGKIYAGISDFFTRHNYRLIFDNLPHLATGAERTLSLAQSRLVDGLLFLLFSIDIKRFKDQDAHLLEKMGLPYVVIHSLGEKLGSNSVGLDCTHGGFLATAHLIKHGYRTIGCVVSHNKLHCYNLYQGYAQALRHYGRTVEEKFTYPVPGGDTIREGYGLAEKMLASGQELPRALVVVDECYAHGIIKKFREAGVRVPQDMAIIGFGDVNHEAVEMNDLNTLAQPAHAKGRAAGELLFNLLQGKPPQPLRHIIFKPELLINKSCGCQANNTSSGKGSV